LIVNAFAKALEIIPQQLCDNAGYFFERQLLIILFDYACRYDSTDILNKLRAEHHKGGKWFGVDVENEGICDTYESFVWEPLLVKRNAISAATEAACLILSVDETVMNPNSEQAKAKANPMNKGALAGLARGRGRGRGRR
jgi:T-complex protein 1 subunit eta